MALKFIFRDANIHHVAVWLSLARGIVVSSISRVEKDTGGRSSHQPKYAGAAAVNAIIAATAR
jgi:hypothetical protein